MTAPADPPPGIQAQRVVLECGHVTRASLRVTVAAAEHAAGFWCHTCACHMGIASYAPLAARDRQAAVAAADRRAWSLREHGDPLTGDAHSHLLRKVGDGSLPPRT